MSSLSGLKGTIVKLKQLVTSVVHADPATSPCQRDSIPDALRVATLTNTPKFTLETHGTRTPARVIDVHDGDTVLVAMKMFNKIWAFRLRLAHVNTPELRPSLTESNRTEIIKKAREARDFLASKVLGHIVWVNILGYEKYGRVLAELYVSERETSSINQLIVASGHGALYEGSGVKT